MANVEFFGCCDFESDILLTEVVENVPRTDFQAVNAVFEPVEWIFNASFGKIV